MRLRLFVKAAYEGIYAVRQSSTCIDNFASLEILEDPMKKIALAAVLSATAATAVSAGNYSEPYIEPTIVVEEAASSSSAGLIVPLMLLVIIAAVASN